MRAATFRRLRPEDAEALASLSFVDSATPNIILASPCVWQCRRQRAR